MHIIVRLRGWKEAAVQVILQFTVKDYHPGRITTHRPRGLLSLVNNNMHYTLKIIIYYVVCIDINY